MLRSLKHGSVLTLSALLLALPVLAQDAARGNLVDVQWLEKNLKNPDLVLIDAQPGQAYTAKHIAGAVHYDLFSYGASGLPAAASEKMYQSWGISPGKKIIIYDQGASYFAPRLFFSLEYYGFPVKDMYILDGGIFKWEAAGLPVTKEPTPPPQKGTFTVSQRNASVMAELPEVVTASGDTEHNALVEGLDADWHFGGITFFLKPGHIPNAIMAPAEDFFNPDKTFKSPQEIKSMLTYLGIKPEQQLYAHCGGGVAASVPYFAAKYIADYPKVKLFVGSQLDWISDPRDLPFWTYDEPYLMRQTQWLQFWDSQQPRMYGITNLALIDVRPADQYSKGHLPFSVNIPPDVFRSSVTNPEKLADALGPAGVKPSQEAVLVSGTGITKESALAFMMLERLGQQKVSIFTDSFDSWTKQGQKITSDATFIGPRSATQPLAIAPTTYKPSLRDGIIIANAASTHDVYPKVFIASGKDMPAKAQDGKVVHLPYTDLLNPDGTPKTATEIWKTLAKAGVPRYAELVCISDDPGEAAANYFILKLMGFPDVKVLAM